MLWPINDELQQLGRWQASKFISRHDQRLLEWGDEKPAEAQLALMQNSATLSVHTEPLRKSHNSVSDHICARASDLLHVIGQGWMLSRETNPETIYKWLLLVQYSATVWFKQTTTYIKNVHPEAFWHASLTCSPNLSGMLHFKTNTKLTNLLSFFPQNTYMFKRFVKPNWPGRTWTTWLCLWLLSRRCCPKSHWWQYQNRETSV